MKFISFDGPTPKDSSYFILDNNNGYHYESERYTRRKEGPDDPFLNIQDINNDKDSVVVLTTNVTSINHSQAKTKDLMHDEIILDEEGYLSGSAKRFVEQRDCSNALRYHGEWVHPLIFSKGPVEQIKEQNTWVVSHHLAHAAHGFISSGLDEALVVTIDGGGVAYGNGDAVGPGNHNKEKDWCIESLCIYKFDKTKYECLKRYFVDELNLGVAYNAVTKYILGSTESKIGGNQCGTVMAMASFYTPHINEDVTSQIINMVDSKRIINGLEQIYGETPDDDTKYSLASSILLSLEKKINSIISPYIKESKNIIFSGGVALNSAMVGKLSEKLYAKGYKVYVPPVPYDAGLTIGAVQLISHYKYNCSYPSKGRLTPYLGREYSKSEITRTIERSEIKCSYNITKAMVVEKIIEGNIVAIYGGKSESGRRALGNRSIICDPTKKRIKSIINQKVKHRQWYRPFAPIVLSEHMEEIFGKAIESDYMSHVLKINPSWQKQCLVLLNRWDRSCTIDR